MPSADALGIFSGNFIFIFAKRKILRDFPLCFFTGGAVERNSIETNSFRHRWRDATSLKEGGSGEKENFAALPKAPSPRELSPQATEGVTKKHPQFSHCGCFVVYW